MAEGFWQVFVQNEDFSPTPSTKENTPIKSEEPDFNCRLEGVDSEEQTHLFLPGAQVSPFTLPPLRKAFPRESSVSQITHPASCTHLHEVPC